jgi:hypothetical protein
VGDDPYHLTTEEQRERMMTADEFKILNPEIQDSASPPLNLLDYAVSRAREPPRRCPAPGCTALGVRTLPDGSRRCLKSGHDPGAYELAAVAGGSE